MSIDLLGPGANATNVVTTRHDETRLFGSVDTFFRDCSSAAAGDGTRVPAAFLNAILTQLRQAIRQAEVAEDNGDDLMLWRAMQAAVAAGNFVTPSGLAAAIANFATHADVTAAINDLHLFTTNGYQRLPSGLILQWGRVNSSVPDETATTYTFPMTFPTACFNVQVSGRYSGIYQDDVIGVHYSTLPTTTGFTVYAINPNSPYPSLPGFYWFAIGY